MAGGLGRFGLKYPNPWNYNGFLPVIPTGSHYWPLSACGSGAMLGRMIRRAFTCPRSLTQIARLTLLLHSL